jgi:adenine-specific DNA-methyltransferase
LLRDIERTRLRLSKATDAKKKARLGQYLTPSRTAAFMAALFPAVGGACRLLDAGAGIGSLSAAFLDRWRSGNFNFTSVDVDAFEIDTTLHEELTASMAKFFGDDFHWSLRAEDFIRDSADALASGLFARQAPLYSHAILNPPYKKISSDSEYRIALRAAGIETVNLYSAFVALALARTKRGGHVVAIIPRSFCNGPYYRPFREFLLSRAAIKRIHLFESRTSAFKDDGVLQENVILHLERDGVQGKIEISTSTDDSFEDIAVDSYPFERIVLADDPERFIHVPTSSGERALELAPRFNCSLQDLDITVSTGPVVDFRHREFLRDMPSSESVPLLYPGHFFDAAVHWPIEGLKKPNALVRNAETAKWLYPVGFYCVVRRFSSKEESRRVVSAVVEPGVFADVSELGFENHLNVFHQRKGGLSEEVARGLTVFLNSTMVDEAFRRFNGHTQVNATDLRLMKYPSLSIVRQLGEWARALSRPTQAQIDEKLISLAT